MDYVDFIKKFVEGKASIKEFVDLLYTDKGFEKLLSSDFELPTYVKVEAANLYFYLLNRNFKKATELINIQSLLESFLATHNIEFLPSDRFSNQLDADLKQNKEKKFPTIKRKPKWLQGSCWPEHKGKPLTFIGQLDISSLRHDTSFIYVFMNESDGTCITIEQSM